VSAAADPPTDTSPNPHPAVRGREDELGALADAVRRLVALTVTNTAPAAETAALAAELDDIADRLAQHVPDPVPPRHSSEATADHTTLLDGTPYDPVVGRWHPFALPLVLGEVTSDPPRATATACFTTPYEGPPGCVHGAVLAGAFDMVLTAANRAVPDAAGPTIELSVQFRKPTRLGVETVFEAWIAERKGRITTTAGRATQDGVVTVEAIGTFIHLPYERVRAMGGAGH
jgi:acyl-coenzyme A thioesterase PaaI-like protein